MSELIRELFERHQAKLLNLDYEELKQQFDRHEECFNKRYATFSCFEKEFDVWEACWNARQSEIDQLKAEKAGLEKSVKQILSDSKESMVGYVEMDLYDKGYRVCTEYLIDELEKALRGEHE
ncbi:hypothetical protein [Acinetobacter sp. KS-LM10]|uniref:hypothetical protein n=1 Tax=Acinetobacter sp. KS-LM10 TaxID=3120518 RepID=UPI0030D1A240